MSECGKLTKLKSRVMKKWTSFSRSSSSSSSSSNSPNMIHNDNKSTEDKHFPVYVGKSLRRYIIDSKTASSPVFRKLLERSASFSSSGLPSESTVIACEVVLFEHLLWMLNNCDNGLEDADYWHASELVEFYAC